MYIKVGKTNIKYRSGVEDYMIFSEIPDSQLSYEKPTLVRTKDELDIWFGRNFTSRNYFDELIKNGVTLYLYKPIKENNTSDVDDYIDIETYYIYPEIFLDLPSSGDSEYMYFLKTIDPIKHYYKFDLVNNRYTWVPVNNLDDYTINPVQHYSISDLPSIGESMVAYYVENIPSYRLWYVFENNSWRELRNRDELDLYTPYRNLFASQDSLPQNGVYRYFVLSDKSWYVWKNDMWTLGNISELQEQEFPIYFDTPEDLPEIGDNYRYYVDGVWYIWLAESWTPETIFPQNLDNISGSLNNRDTLMISKVNDNINYIPYSYPEFRLFENNHLGVFSREYDINYDINYPNVNESDLSSIELGYKTMAIKLSYSSENLDDGYIIIKSQESSNSYCCYTGESPKVSAIYFSERFQISTVQELIDKYIELGYKTIQTNENEYLIYSNKLFDFNGFYTYSNIKLENSFEDTENILTNYLQRAKGFEFYSKTIGTEYENSNNNIESLISINIESTEYEIYRVTISRYDYTEIFEGPIFTEVGEERLDNIINNNSKLVMCDIVGLKNYIRPRIYSGVISESGIDYTDFYGLPIIYKTHYYVPPTGEVGIKYKVYDEHWKTWIWVESEERFRYIDIDRLYYDFYNLTEEVLNYQTLEDLNNEVGNSEFKYFVESENKWYTWKDDSNRWEILERELLPGEEYSIKVEKLGYENYAIYILAGEFSETYRGDLFELQDMINKSSEIFKEFKFKDLCNKLREGTFYLRRGKNEVQTKDMYIKSLGCIFDTQIENTWPDYFLVPDIKKYTNNLGEIESVEKNIFLEHAKEFNCQFLIQNNNPTYKLINIEDIGVDSFNDITNPEDGVLYVLYNGDEAEYRILDPESKELVEYTNQDVINESISGGDFIYNYTKDTSNYLVYFFRPLTILGNSRPGYYTFLRGLLRNVFSFEETLINYDSPLENDPYEVDHETLSTSLEKYKSNFLINNNHVFYYKKYFNGPKYYSTIWMRFVIGKICRELQKNRWSYLSNRSMGVVETEIKNTLRKINSRFSIVSYIGLTKFSPNLSENSLEITIETYVRDLMSNNMTLDITINYNEINTD